MSKARMLARFIASYFDDEYEYDYWHCPHPKSELISRGDYFIDFSRKTEYPGPFDTRGIPLLDLNTQHWSMRRDVVYSPIVIEQFALGWYHRFLRDGSTEGRQRLLDVAAWLMDSGVHKRLDGREALLLPTDYGHGNVLSAMAQGLAVSLWCRAARESGDSAFLDRAFEAFVPLTVDLEAGGVVDRLPGYPILQEWANERVHIFNGHLFAFAGIADLLVHAPTERRAAVRAAYDTHLASSLRMAEQVDLGFWTRYSLRRTLVPNIASHFYHRLHVDMLNGLCEMTGDDRFGSFATRFAAQRRSTPARVLALTLKLLDRASTDLMKN